MNGRYDSDALLDGNFESVARVADVTKLESLLAFLAYRGFLLKL
jgi:hypothetical protein